MKKINLFSSLLLLFFAACGNCDQTVIVTNDSSIARVGEVVELEIDNPDQYAIYDAAGKALQCQTTYDGKLIFQANVAANSTAEYTLVKGIRPDLDTIALGKVYPQWFDNYAWENDKIGFRVYDKAIAKSGQKLYGFDIFTKRSKRPVLETLYSTTFDPEYQKIKKGLSAKSRSILTAATSIHIDHGLGMDYYAVGPTLGSGTTALTCDGQIVYPIYYDKVEILDAGGLRNTFRLTFSPVEINGEQVTEVRTLTLDAGSHFNNIKVDYKGLTKSTDAVIGIVLHDNGENQSSGDGYIAYAEPKHEFGWQTYNAIIFPEAMSRETQMFDAPAVGAYGAPYGHLLARGKYSEGQTINYYMGAGWNRWGFATPQEWFAHVAEQKAALDAPLTCKIK